MDACTGDHRDDLADSLPDHSRDLWLRIRAGTAQEAAVAGGVAVRHQSCVEPDLHPDPVRDEKPAIGGC